MIRMRFVWIDDQAFRNEKWRAHFEAGPDNVTASADIELFAADGDLLSQFQSWVSANAKTPPDLFMVDHDLQQSLRHDGLHLKGSSLAHLLRLNFPSVPVVCVSGQPLQSREFDWEDLSEYTHVFPISQLNYPEHIELIFAIATDYPKICISSSTNVRRDIVDALGAPAADRESLFAILPEEFEVRVVHGTTPHRIARWILNVLMDRPGFLLDALSAATFVGLSEAAFSRVAPTHFQQAEYRGPFATAARKLWWSSELTTQLYASVPDAVALPPQLAGRRLPQVTAKDYSVCVVTSSAEPPPDVVAFLDDQLRDRAAMRSDFTEPIGAEAALGFAPRLKMRRTPR